MGSITEFFNPHRPADAPQTLSEFHAAHSDIDSKVFALEAESKAKKAEQAAVVNGMVTLHARGSELQQKHAANANAQQDNTAIDRALRLNDEAIAHQHERATALTAEGTAAAAIRSSWQRYVRGQLLSAGVAFTRSAPVTLPKGESLPDLVSRSRREIRALRLKADEKRSEMAPLEGFLQTALARFPKVPAPFTIGIDDAQRPTVLWEHEGVNAEPRFVNGDLPSVTDAKAIALWLHHDAIVAEVERQVRELYEDNPPVSTGAEKRSFLAQVAADVLALERLEAAACWAAREQSIHVPWRKDIDVRAVFGIIGPRPAKSRDDG